MNDGLIFRNEPPTVEEQLLQARIEAAYQRGRSEGMAEMYFMMKGKPAPQNVQYRGA